MNRNELIRRYNAGIKISYIFFWGHKSRNNFVDRTCLSQWYISYFGDTPDSPEYREDALKTYYQVKEQVKNYVKKHRI